MTDPHKMFQKKHATLTIKIKLARQKANEHDDGSRAFAESIVKTAEKYENQLDSLATDTFVDIDMSRYDTRLYEEVMGSILKLKFEYENEMRKRTSSMSNCNLDPVPSTSASTCEPQHVKKDVHSKPEEQRWQDINTNIKVPSRSKGLRKIAKKLESFTLMTIESKTPITKLREVLTEIDQIEPEEVRQLIDLTIVQQLLTNENDEHQLTKDERNTIVMCLLESAITVARQIVEDCKQDSATVFTYFKQIQIYSRFVRGIAKMTTADLEQYKNHCQSYRDTLDFINQNPNVRNAKMMDYYVQMLDELLQKYRIGLDLQIGLLKYMELNQSTAQNVNEDQAINMPIKNFCGILRTVICGLLRGVNLVALKSIEKRKEMMKQMEEEYDSVGKLLDEAVELKLNLESINGQINESNNEPNGQTIDSANETLLETSFFWVDVIDESVTVEAVPDDQSAQDEASQTSKSKDPDHKSNNAASQLIEAIELKGSLDSVNGQNQPNGQTCESLIEASMKVSFTLDDVTDVTVEAVPNDQSTQNGASQSSESNNPNHESNIENAETVDLLRCPRFVVRPNVIHRSNWSYPKK